jgi:DNA-binding PadR family transcriptional regulator
MKETYLGEFEHLVLLAVLRLGEEAYAVPIRETIATHSGRSVARGALYTTLDRLEQKRLLRSTMGDALPERGGRPRRYYTVTAAGLRYLQSAHRAIGGHALDFLVDRALVRRCDRELRRRRFRRLFGRGLRLRRFDRMRGARRQPQGGESAGASDPERVHARLIAESNRTER